MNKFTAGLKKLNPKNLGKKKKHKHDQDGDDSDGNTMSNGENSMSSPALSPALSPMAPGMISMKHPPGGQPMPVGAQMNMMGGASGFVPPGMKLMSGPPPPGVKLMSGPPPPGAKIIMSRPGSPSPSMMGGVKTMPNLPPGVKMMMGSPPPGAKIMKSPPPGFMMKSPPMGPSTKSPPPGMGFMPRAQSPPSLIPGLPPGAKMMSGPPPPGATIMTGLPPGVKMMSGPPPPGAKMITSRPGTPSSIASGIPPGAKLMTGPPPPGAKLLSGPPPPGAYTSPPRPLSPSLPPGAKLISQLPPGAQLVRSPSQSPLHPMSKSPPAVPLAKKVVPTQFTTSAPPAAGTHPQLARPVAQRVPPPHARAATPNLGSTVMSLKSDDVQLKEEGAQGSEIDFHVEEEPQRTKSVPEKSPPAAIPTDAASDTSSAIFHEEPDVATAAPKPGKAASVNSLQSSAQQEPQGKTKHKSKKREKSSADKKVDDWQKETARGASAKRKNKDASDFSSEVTPSSANTPRPVDFTDRKGGSLGQRGDSAEAIGQEGGGTALFQDSALVPMALTSSLRSKVAEHFLSILCPQQYYGRVRKISSIKPIKANRELATGLRKNNSIFVATKGTMPNSYFYPQLRLEESDGHPSNDEDDPGSLETPIILYEAAPGIMLFAESELEARRVLENNENATSCFVLESSAILFKFPEQYVVPMAMLTVRWTPYSAPQSEPQCPIHKRELQLFDPYSKELVCALCASHANINKSKLVVIPDVLGGDSRRRIQESVSQQLEEAQRSAKQWLGQHQRIAQMADNKKQAINQQFDFLISVVETKRKQFLEGCDAEFGFALSDVAREILISDEKVQLLSAATDHLRTEVTKPLYSMQIATIAEALEAKEKFPSRFSVNSLQVPCASAGLLPHLEGVMTEIQSLTPSLYAGGGGNKRAPSKKNTPQKQLGTSRHSPFATPKALAAPPPAPPPVPDEVAVPRGADPYHGRPLEEEDTRQSRTRASAKNGRSSGATRRRTTTPPTGVKSGSLLNSPHPERDVGRSPSKSPTAMKRIGKAEAKRLYATNTPSVPNSTGTSLFDYPIEDLLGDADDASTQPSRPHCVQWAVRVEDPGDWVGIGVGVGNTIEAWEHGRRNDLSHLWIVPYTGTAQTYLLRVTVSSKSGHAKLSIHDSRGRQLDDGSIPQWNSSRPCYPQATFGGRTGQVRMTEIPHLI